jgi:DNA-binding NarL/FixJ family response regulator
MSDAVPKAPIRVLLQIENRLLQDALERLFRKRTDLEVVGREESERCTREGLGKTAYDVVVLDFFDSSRLPPKSAPKSGEPAPPKAVLIGMGEEPEEFLAAVHAGVTGYLLKEASAAEVIAAVHATYRGEAICPPQLCAALFQYVSRSSSREGLAASAPTAVRPLTLRQQRLIALVAKGLTNKEIGARLNISEYTVKNHIHRILKNVDAETRSEAVEAARSYGYSMVLAESASEGPEIERAVGVGAD